MTEPIGSPMSRYCRENNLAMVDVYVGRDKRVFALPWTLLLGVAPSLQRTLTQYNELYLPTIGNQAFGDFLQWLSSGSVVFSSENAGELARRAINLFFLGKDIGSTELQNVAIRVIYNAGKGPTAWKNPQQEIKRIFSATQKEHPLRTLITMVVAFRYLSNEENIKDLADDLKDLEQFGGLFWASVKEIAYPPTYPKDVGKYLIPLADRKKDNSTPSNASLSRGSSLKAESRDPRRS